MSSAFKIRPSEVTCYEECPRQYFFRYVLRIPEEVLKWFLPYGTAIHSAIDLYLKEQIKTGEEMAAAFSEQWRAQAQGNDQIQYGDKWSFEQVLEMGKLVMTRFPESWQALNLTIQRDESGPLIERRLEAPIGNGVIISGCPDTVTLTPDMNTRTVDFKTPASPAGDAFLANSEQCKMYDILLDYNGLLIGKPEIQYLELLKRPVPKKNGKGPTIEATKPVTPTENDRKEIIQKITWMVGDMLDGRFPKRPRMAYNSPCDMCAYAERCRDYKFDQLAAKALMRERIFWKQAA